jgi:eukaryotic-like serine/threonine-protein kinase
MGIVHPFTIPGNRSDLLQASAAGTNVGPYKLISMLGRGGMSTVWLAERVDGGLGRRVALKLSDSPVAEFNNAQRFLRERDILARLEHPHIARLYDAGVTEDGRPWLALEYVEGLGLAGWCDEQRLTLRDRVKLFREVLEAVQYAHAALIIHRDIKPANIMVTREGAVRLLDFGIAKLLKVDSVEAHATMLTQMAGHAMTMAYASPEQLREEPLTTATDIYSLGVVLYELLTGVMPYKTKLRSAAQLEQAIINGDVTAPSRCAFEGAAAETRQSNSKQLKKIMNRDLDAIVLKAMRTDRSRRYETATAMLADLDRWLANEPVQARRPSAWDHASKFVRRHPWGTGLGTAAVCGLIAASVMAGMMAVQAKKEAAKAESSRDFLLGLFKDADPDLSNGQELKARDLLAAGVTSQPELKAELLKQIATAYRQFGQSEDADRLLAQRTSIISGLNDPLLLADALLEEADIDGRSMKLDEVDKKLARVRDLLKLRKPVNQLQARLALSDGRVAQRKFDYEAAAAHFELALRAARADGGPKLLMTTLSAAAELAQLSGRYQDAIAKLAESETIGESVPNLDVGYQLEQRYQRLLVTFYAGEFVQGWPAMQQLMADAQALFGRSSPRLRPIALLWLPWAANAGALDSAAAWIETHRMEELTKQASVSNRIDWLRSFASVRIRRGEYEEAIADIDAGLALTGGDLQRSATLRLTILKAEALLLQGHGDQALSILESKVNFANIEKAEFKTTASSLNTLRAFALAQSGDFSNAEAAMKQALQFSRRWPGNTHPKTATAQLNMVLLALRRTSDAETIIWAREQLEQAAAVLKKALPETHPTNQAITSLLAYCQSDFKSKGSVPHGANRAVQIISRDKNFFFL